VNDAIDRTLIDADELSTRVEELARQISVDYAGRELVLVCVLKGAVFFLADLARRLTIPCSLDFMAVSSYGSATDSSGTVRILKDLGHHRLRPDPELPDEEPEGAQTGLSGDLRAAHQAVPATHQSCL
jgi:hypoxanthine-guanine phosphoribosyltransferase